MTKFRKGESGNPAGRPRGVPNPMTRLRHQITEGAPAIIGILLAKAKEGDTQAASLLLSRCLPPLRPQTEQCDVELPGDSLAERVEAVVAGALRGALSPTAAGELMAVLAGQARVKEVVEIEERLAVLEARK